MEPPKTRTELKKSGKRDKGPYTSKHVRIAEELRRTQAEKNKLPSDIKLKGT